MKKNILITGATSGLGLMLTRFFDKKNYELFITGRDKKKISQIKKTISLANKDNCFAFDFENKKNLFKFLKVIKKKKKNLMLSFIVLEAVFENTIH